MPTTAETKQAAPVETLSPQEMGKRSFDLMTGMVNNLAATPEFTTALAQAFFRRQGSIHTSGNDLGSVYFQKGAFAYLVDWTSTRFEPRSHGQPEPRDMIRSGLTVTKYDPREEIDGWSKKVATISFSSDFLEGEDGEILRFTGGCVSLEADYDLESSWETPSSWRTAEPTTKSEGSEAIDKSPEFFADITPAPVKP
ncbi:MAG: hypothetical protein HYV40_05375 [Candidatus Levybacteria bacterium]|nr:hypothetical protein [Candidatus Levybacteria bacterium]